MRTDFSVTPISAKGHRVHLSVADGRVVADCVCGLHAERFTSQQEVFDFLASHEAGHIRTIPKGAFRAL